MRDTVIIVEEDNLPHPRFPQCYILFMWEGLNKQDPTTSQCDKGVYMNRNMLETEETQAGTERYFRVYILRVHSNTFDASS